MISRFFNKTISVVLLVCLSVSPLNAGIGSYVNQQVDQIKEAAKSFRMDGINTQTRNITTFGGFRDHYNLNSRVHPVRITLPSASFGCGGLDINWGGVSALTFEHLIETFQHILEAAPAFAFSMAFSTLCKDCNGIMQSLQKTASMLNSIALDKCAAAKAAGDLGAEVGKSIGSNQASIMGESKSVLDHIGSASGKVTEGINLLNDLMNTGLCAVQNNYGVYATPSELCQSRSGFSPVSILKTSIKEKDFGLFPSGTQDELESLMRGLVGDFLIIYEHNVPPDGQHTLQPETVQPETTVTIESLHKAILKGAESSEKLKGLLVTMDNSFKPPSPRLPVDITIDTATFNSLERAVFLSFHSALTKMRTQVALDNTDLQYMLVEDFPVYKIINMFSVHEFGHEYAVRTLAVHVAETLAARVLNRIFDRMLLTINSYATSRNKTISNSPYFQYHFSQMVLSITNSKAYLHKKQRESAAELMYFVNAAIETNQLNRMLLDQIMASSLSNQYLFSRIYGNR